MSEKECVFCDQKTFADTLISNQRNFWIVATRGQITDGYYLLIIPKRHVRCLGEMTTEEIRDVDVLSEFVRRVMKFELSYSDGTACELTLFEHGIVGQTVQHAHLHLLPAPLDFTEKVRGDFPLAEIDHLVALRDLPRAYALSKEPYLFWQSPGQAPMICWNPNAPPQYFRTIAAEILGRPERANWRQMDPELDKKLILKTIERLQHYFL